MQRGLIEAGTRKPDLLMLDLGLPDGDGIELIRDVRGWSARADHRAVGPRRRGRQDRRARCRRRRLPDQAVRHGRAAGAGARQPAAAARRTADGAADEADPVFRFGDVEVDRRSRGWCGAPARRCISRRSSTGCSSVLVANAGRVLTHRQLLREVWGPAHAEQSHYLRIYMGHLRQKLEADPAQPRHLLTETAVGYRLLADV